MLLKNLFFTALLAGQSLASPLSVTIDIDLNEHSVEPIRLSQPYPYEKINLYLVYQGQLVGDIKNNVTELSDDDKTGIAQLVADLKGWGADLTDQAKNLDDQKLSEGETGAVEPDFVNVVEVMADLCDAIDDKADDIKKADPKGQVAKAFLGNRSQWGYFASELIKLLYKCDKDEKKEGCEGATPFLKSNRIVLDKMKETSKKLAAKEALPVQFDL